MVRAARCYNQIVETGTQQRSAPHFPEVAEMVQSGRLGMVHFVRVWNYLGFFGTEATIYADRYGYEIYPERGSALEHKTVNVRDATGGHTKNFAEAIRGNSRLGADVELGHRATTIDLLGNISYLTCHKLI